MRVVSRSSVPLVLEKETVEFADKLTGPTEETLLFWVRELFFAPANPHSNSGYVGAH